MVLLAVFLAAPAIAASAAAADAAVPATGDAALAARAGESSSSAASPTLQGYDPDVLLEVFGLKTSTTMNGVRGRVHGTNDELGRLVFFEVAPLPPPSPQIYFKKTFPWSSSWTRCGRFLPCSLSPWFHMFFGKSTSLCNRAAL